MKKFKIVILLSLVMAVVACSEEHKEQVKKESRGDHVWKSQTDTIQTTRDAAKKLQDTLNQQQQRIDESN